MVFVTTSTLEKLDDDYIHVHLSAVSIILQVRTNG